MSKRTSWFISVLLFFGGFYLQQLSGESPNWLFRIGTILNYLPAVILTDYYFYNNIREKYETYLSKVVEEREYYYQQYIETLKKLEEYEEKEEYVSETGHCNYATEAIFLEYYPNCTCCGKPSTRVLYHKRAGWTDGCKPYCDECFSLLMEGN